MKAITGNKSLNGNQHVTFESETRRSTVEILWHTYCTLQETSLNNSKGVNNLDM